MAALLKQKIYKKADNEVVSITVQEPPIQLDEEKISLLRLRARHGRVNLSAQGHSESRDRHVAGWHWPQLKDVNGEKE